MAETGTSSFGLSTQRLADGSRYVSQVLYGSIGFATAGTVSSKHPFVSRFANPN